ncbi:hypothetical protein G5I_08964 [Acromyrmex echinatior]|uniref:Uncharacterized protein n=1 Tax=Acromyrmex echinatior TaxID=103372 RepID=F4WSX2_ACREC|nr:hypothetical protein G5I_08964 [Acromyrmex echinatior]
MPSPYGKEDFQLITDLADAEDWVSYSIKVKTKTSKNLCRWDKKLKKLEEQLYAFTESAADPITVAAAIEESLKIENLKRKVDDLKEMMTVSQIPDKDSADAKKKCENKLCHTTVYLHMSVINSVDDCNYNSNSLLMIYEKDEKGITFSNTYVQLWEFA